MDVIVYAHTHWDREWYRPFQEFRLRLVDIVDFLIEQLNTGKLDNFYFDGQTIALNDYLEIDSDKKNEILRLIKNKKLFVGPWYVLADEFLVSGESLVRNLLIGINQSKDYGCYDYIGYLPDAFGHCSDIPRIMNLFNINNVIVWRGVGTQKSEFIWKSIDESSVLATYLTEGYFQDFFHWKVPIERKTKAIRKQLNKIKKFSVTDTILLPAGADHLAPAKDLSEQIEEVNKHINGYKLIEGSPFDYIKKLDLKNLNLNNLKGELRDNCRNFILPGTYSTRLYIKKANAKSTWKLSKLAEPFHSLLQASGIVSPRNEELDYAWKLLLQNHPHDSICGCSVDEVHDEMMPRFSQVDQISEGLIARGFNKLAHRVKSGKLIIFNASNYPFTGVIKVKSHNPLPKNIKYQYLRTDKAFPPEVLFDLHRAPIQEDVREYKEYLVWIDNIAPNSIKVIGDRYIAKEKPKGVKVTDKSIGNPLVNVEVDKDGTLILTDLESGKKFDRLHSFKDFADKGDTYNFCPIKFDNPRLSILIKSEIAERGDLRSVLRLFYEMEIPESLDKNEKYRSMAIITQLMIVDVIVHSGSKRVEFKTMWENLSRDHILQLRFGFNDKVYKTVSENNFGLIERQFNPDYNVVDYIPAEKDKELKMNTAPMQRFVWANGLGIIGEGLSEYGLEGDELYLTALRSVGLLSRGAMDTRGTPAGPPLLTPGSQCLGVQRIRYALYPTSKPQELLKEADQFMRSILAEVGISEDTSGEKSILSDLLKINNPNIYIYAVKPTFNQVQNELTIRLMNISNKKQALKLSSDIKFSKIFETNGLEEKSATEYALTDKIEFKPYELKTLILD